MISRCPWAEKDEYSRKYHDTRWCCPLHDDQELFAMLILEGMQAGLSWSLILKREEGIRKACDGLDPTICALYDEKKETELMSSPSMIRNRRKIASIAVNARAFLKVQKEFGSFDAYIWHFTERKVIDNRLHEGDTLPATSDLSDLVCRDLQKRGFKFVGSTIVYSYLQGIGIINDHLDTCSFKIVI